MSSYIYKGYGITNENGIAKLQFDENGDPIDHSYTGVGAGEIDFVASLDNPIQSGSLVSRNHPVYDAPVYDGDNVPATISWSKTNNAVLTDEVVSLTASVKNQNGNPCIHVPVTFVEEGTGSNRGTSRTLGTVYTDVYGDAVLTEVWTDATICDIVGSTTGNVSEDIRMFIKDKNNLLTFNQWSCGDYTQSFQDMTYNDSGRCTISNEESTNGDFCLKLTPTVDEYAILRFVGLNLKQNKTYNLTFDYKNSVSSARIHFRKGNSTIQEINIPLSSKFLKRTIQVTLLDDIDMIIFWTYNSEYSCYVDDVTLVEI